MENPPEELGFVSCCNAVSKPLMESEKMGNWMKWGRGARLAAATVASCAAAAWYGMQIARLMGWL